MARTCIQCGCCRAVEQIVVSATSALYVQKQHQWEEDHYQARDAPPAKAAPMDSLLLLLLLLL
jgi:hypothetical protein